MAETDPKSPSIPEETTQRDTSQVEISLKYDGNDVRQGTMEVEDVISALRGFSAAYSKIAARRPASEQHEIRVSNVKKSSFAVVIVAWTKEHPGAVAATGAAVQWVVATIIQLIKFHKATRGRPGNPTISVVDAAIVINAGDNVQISMPKEIFEIYESGSIDSDLNRIVAPLEKDHIDNVTLAATGSEGFSEDVKITASEKQFFQASETRTITSRETELEGVFVSLNKESNRGVFKLQNRRKVPYRFSGDDLVTLHREFAAKGEVRVQCVAHFDENLEVKQLEITRVARLQGNLF